MPKLRFPEFEGRWTEDSFESQFEFLSNNTLSRAELSSDGNVMNIHYGDVLIKFGNTLDCKSSLIPFVSPTADLGRRVEFLQDGDCIVADTAEDEAVGKATELYNIGNMKVVSGLHTIPCRPLQEYAPGYLGYYLNSQAFHSQLYSLMQGIKVLSISKTNISKTIIKYPTYCEQKKIATLFALLDRKIDIQEKLVDSLKSYKRGLATALFSHKMRLHQEDGSAYAPWSQVPLGSVFCERIERASGTEKLLAVTISNGVQDRADLDLKDNSSNDKQNYRVVRVGDLAYNTMRMWQGACGVSAYEGIVSPAYTVLYPRNPHDTYTPFWAYLFKEPDILHAFQKNSQGLTSDTWNLKYDKFSRITVCAPTVLEQCHISNVLDNLTIAIQKQEVKFDLLYEYKRGLLTMMFI